MSSSRIRFVLLLALTVFATSAFAATSQTQQVFGPIPVDKLIVMPDTRGHIDWVETIENAHDKIHMTMYHLTDNQVLDALINTAKRRSVDIRILVDRENFKGHSMRAIQKLLDAGISVRPATPRFHLTHSKDMVVDNEAFIGAVNLTNTSTRSRDFAIETSDTNIIREIESVFEADWKNAADKTKVTPKLSDPNLVWSPTDSQSQLVRLIDSAQSTLVAETENFNASAIVDALNRAAARGVHVRLVLPECSYGNPDLNYRGIQNLKQVDVHMEHSGNTVQQPYMHSKMMVVDGQRIYVGSINFSYNSIGYDRELGVIFTDLPTAQRLGQEFETDWNRSQTPKAKPDCGQFQFHP